MYTATLEWGPVQIRNHVEFQSLVVMRFKTITTTCWVCSRPWCTTSRGCATYRWLKLNLTSFQALYRFIRPNKLAIHSLLIKIRTRSNKYKTQVIIYLVQLFFRTLINFLRIQAQSLLVLSTDTHSIWCDKPQNKIKRVIKRCKVPRPHLRKEWLYPMYLSLSLSRPVTQIRLNSHLSCRYNK